MNKIRHLFVVASLVVGLCGLDANVASGKTAVSSKLPRNPEQTYKIKPGGELPKSTLSERDLRRVIEKPSGSRDLNWDEANLLRSQLSRVKGKRQLTPQEAYMQERLEYFTNNYKTGRISVDPQDASLLKRVMDDHVVFQDPLHRELEANVSEDGSIPLKLADKLTKAIYKVAANRELTPAELQLQRSLERLEYRPGSGVEPEGLPRMSDTLRTLVKDNAMIEAGYSLKIDAVDTTELNQLENLLGGE